MKKEIKELISAMQKIKREDAEISISHKLYGEQKIRCNFTPITDERVGFYVNKHDIYINKNEIKNIKLGHDIYFSDGLMEIMIKIK